MRFRKLMDYAVDFNLLGVNVPLLVLGLVVLIGGSYGLSKIPQTASLLMALLGIVIVLLMFSEAAKNLRRDDDSSN